MNFVVLAYILSDFSLHICDAPDVLSALQLWKQDRKSEFVSATDIFKMMPDDFEFDLDLDEPTLINGTSHVWSAHGSDIQVELNVVAECDLDTYIFLYDGGTYVQQMELSDSLANYAFSNKFKEYLKRLEALAAWSFPPKNTIEPLCKASIIGSLDFDSLSVEFIYAVSQESKQQLHKGPVLIRIVSHK